jgi:hypothetical protein
MEILVILVSGEPSEDRLPPQTRQLTDRAGAARRAPWAFPASSLEITSHHAVGHRLPIRPLYGPNLARELVKDSSAAAWQSGNIVARVGHEIGRMLPR